jgi:hypothetical protein
MSALPIDHASLKIEMKRAPLWPFATRTMCEEVIRLLSKDELVKEFSSPKE